MSTDNSNGFTATTAANSDVSVHTGATSTVQGSFSSGGSSGGSSGSSDLNVAMTVIGIVWAVLVLVGVLAHMLRVRPSTVLTEAQKRMSFQTALFGVILFPLELVPIYFATQA